jgi:putative FmdB family regulatory protein
VPTYDYQCRSCGTTTEVIHSMLEEGPTTCERCGGQLRRVFFPAGIIFKGAGFYKTDSRASGLKSTSAAAATGAGDGASTAAGSGSSSGAGSDGGSDSSGTPSPATDAGKGPLKKESAGS